MDAYGFVGNLSGDFDEFTGHLQANVGPVRFAAPVAGAFSGLVAAMVEDLGELTGVTTGLTAGGASDIRWATTLTSHSIAGGTKVKTAGARVGAVVAITSPKPRQTARTLNHRLGWMNDPEARDSGYIYALTRTYGACDLVLDLGVPDVHDLADKLDEVRNLGPGVAVDVVLADFGVGVAWRRED